MKNEKGFTLLELLLVLLFLIVVFLLTIPVVLGIINKSKLDAFKNSTYSLIDSVELYVADSKFIEIPKSGISINDLDIKLKNNSFDSGMIKTNNHKKLELIYLIKDNYCAMGTKENLKVSDKGCGALDTTNPTIATLYKKNATKNSITIVASGEDLEGEIVEYEFKIDNGDYVKNEDGSNIYTFNELNSGYHKFQVRITNEAGLKTESKTVSFSTVEVSKIICSEIEGLEGIQKSKELRCEYPISKKYIYQISNDSKEWTNIDLNNGFYNIKINEKQNFYTRILEEDKVVASTYIQIENIDTELNGAYPELVGNMIPVIYDDDKQSWIKADDRKSYWNYSNQIWANAVIVRKNNDIEDLNSKSREYYLSNEAILEPIYEGDIIAHYVWIPRYKYKLWNVNGIEKQRGFFSPIEIEFQSSENKDLGKEEEHYRNGLWYTHPAFTYQDQELSGIWVNKYQSSAASDSACYFNPNTNNCNTQLEMQIYSIPNSKSITHISASTAFTVAQNMNKKFNIYGFSDNSNPHVLTNIEWGSIVYLAHSKYGINKDVEQSTTGNITGVFDLNNSYFELVMANYNKDSGDNEIDNSGFKEYGIVDWPSDNINYYKGVTSKSRILGDATDETKNWYNSTSNFVNGNNPFMLRGGIVDQTKSIFNYTSYTGSAKENVTFRTAIFNIIPTTTE